MDLSYIAINRIIEDRVATDRKYRKEIENNSKTLLSSGRIRSDDELLEKLRSFNLLLDRKVFIEMCNNFLSAEDLFKWLIKKHDLNANTMESDWIWVSLTILWERWIPHKPSFEMIDDMMQEGYKKLNENDRTGACDIWLEVFKNILNILNYCQMKFLNEFDEKFRGTQSVFNWVQDFEMELTNAGLENEKYFKDRILFCEECINRFPLEDSIIENMKNAIADSYKEIGELEKTELLYNDWLKNDPEWGWGWIGWSDCYWLFNRKAKNFEKAENILKEAISIANVRNKEDVYKRLEDIYAEAGRNKDAENIHKERISIKKLNQDIQISANEKALRLKNTYDFGEEGIPLDEFERTMKGFKKQHHTQLSKIEGKIGRNKPCLCGSGKKYKKCCLLKVH